ncbi:hypothetical protein E2R51_02390 [Jeotgalibacillus sp. S-D1]|uniref:hypothetical protein n=1 Tax=Jeotgalibacillus sp. S-D1 TaxID=2552189 RepID=UPI00105A6CBA|nr:hypothetical protein [Jeotgalibacillus sp. S-D1]TDL34586.1 hypothetical protein E2R51_02390 [Jeotgalibacillus sp. S-D1]
MTKHYCFENGVIKMTQIELKKVIDIATEKAINTSAERRAKLGWLKKNSPESYGRNLKAQKFLFFYESLAKAEEKGCDFSYIKGYNNGPVFSEVYGDNAYRKEAFDMCVEQSFLSKPDAVDIDTAKFAKFMVEALSESELSDLTHEFNIWKCKEEEIVSRSHVSLSEADFDLDDKTLVLTLKKMYSKELIEKSKVISIGEKSFVFLADQAKKLNPDYIAALETLSKNEELINPVFVEIDEEGVMVLD